MNWKLNSRETFYVMVYKKEFNEENAASGIPKFFKQYKNSDLAKTVPANIGVCETPDFGCDWVYSIGAQCTEKIACPKGFEKLTIPSAQWAVFYDAPESELRNYIYGEWFLTGGYEILPGFTLEYYNENGEITEIHIPVCKRK